jgi:hypothetical protein
MAGTAAEAGDDGFATLVSSLTSLTQHVKASIRLIDSAIAREIGYDGADASNVVVLDDVKPQYLKASHALNSCSASLDAVLKSLLEGEAHQTTGAQGWLVAARPNLRAPQKGTGPYEL